MAGFYEDAPTMGVDINPVCFNNAIFNVWEVGDTHRGVEIAGYSVGGDCAIIFTAEGENIETYLNQLPEGMPYVVVDRDGPIDPFHHLLAHFDM